jgi:hypothetical protein
VHVTRYIGDGVVVEFDVGVEEIVDGADVIFIGFETGAEFRGAEVWWDSLV